MVVFPELILDTCMEWKEPPKLEGYALEGSAASKCEGRGFGLLNDIEHKCLKRKLYTKWRLTCSFPGLHLRVQR